MNSSLKWSVVLAMSAAAVAIRYQQYQHRFMAHRQMPWVTQRWSLLWTTQDLWQLKRLPNGKLLVPPLLPFVKALVVFDNETEAPTRQPPMQYSDFVWFKDPYTTKRNRQKSAQKTQHPNVMSYRLSFRQIFLKVTDYYRRYVLLKNRCSIPIRDVHKTFHNHKNKYTIEMTNGTVSDLTDIRLSDNVSLVYTAGKGPRLYAEMAYGRLRMSFAKYQTEHFVCNYSRIGKYKFSLESRDTSNATLELNTVVLRARIVVKLTKRNMVCKASLESLWWAMNGGNWTIGGVKPVDGHMTRYLPVVKHTLLVDFRRIVRRAVKRYFKAAIMYADVCKYVLLYVDSLADPPLSLSGSDQEEKEKEDSDDFPQFKLPQL